MSDPLKQPPGYPEAPAESSPSNLGFAGMPTRVLLECDMGEGRKFTVPVGDIATFTPADGLAFPYGELVIPIREPLMRRLHQARRDILRKVGP